FEASNPDRAGSRAISGQFLFPGTSVPRHKACIVTSLIWATLPVLPPALWLAGQSGILSSAVESAPAAAVVVQLQFADATFVPLFGAPECSAIQTEHVPAGSNAGRSHERLPRSRA